MKMNCVNLISLLMLPTTMHHNLHTHWLPCNKSCVSFVNVSKSHMCNLSMYQKSMYLKAMSHIVSVLKVMGSKKSFPSKTHKYSA